MSQDQWIRISEAAELLGFSDATVRRWADEGLLKVKWSKPGNRGQRWISVVSIEEYKRSVDPDLDVDTPDQ